MEAAPGIIELLNDVLTGELTAVNQYFAHAKWCAHWGYERLAEHNREESIGEMRDAEKIADRILYLDGAPNFQRLGSVMVGENVPEQFQLDLDLETAAIARLNAGIATCVAAGDNGTRDLLAEILAGEEEHADWLETQLEAISQMGIENYLAQKLHS